MKTGSFAAPAPLGGVGSSLGRGLEGGATDFQSGMVNRLRGVPSGRT